MGAQSCKEMIVVGGCALSLEREPIDIIEKLFLKDNKLHSTSADVPPLPTAVRSPALLMHKLSLLVIGGCTGPRKHSTAVQIFESGSWSAEHSSLKLNEGRSCHCVATYKDFLYVLGGWDGISSMASVERAELTSAVP